MRRLFPFIFSRQVPSGTVGGGVDVLDHYDPIEQKLVWPEDHDPITMGWPICTHGIGDPAASCQSTGTYCKMTCPCDWTQPDRDCSYG